MEKMIKYARFFDFLLKAGKVLITVVIWAVVLGIGAVALFSEPGMVTVYAVLFIIAAIAAWVIEMKILNEFLRVVAPMKIGRPFERGMSGSFHKRGVLTLIGGVVDILGVGAGVMLLKSFNPFVMTRAASAGMIGVTNVKVDIDLGFIIMALFYFFVECIMRYGEELQTRADETL